VALMDEHDRIDNPVRELVMDLKGELPLQEMRDLGTWSATWTIRSAKGSLEVPGDYNESDPCFYHPNQSCFSAPAGANPCTVLVQIH
jgi:hypothetical protein